MLLRCGLLIKLVRNPINELRTAQIEHFFDDFGLELIPEYDRQAVLDSLTEDGLVEFSDTHTGSGTQSSVERYGLTSLGISTVEAERKNPGSPIYRILVNGDEWLQKHVEEVYGLIMESPLEVIPAPPTAEIDFNQFVEQQKQLLAKLDQLVDALNANNAFRHGDSASHAWVMADLAELRTQIGCGHTKVSRLESAGYGALTYVAKKFADSVISTYASDIWKIIINVARHLF